MTAPPAYTPTAEERRAIARGRAELRTGKGISLEEVHAELTLPRFTVNAPHERIIEVLAIERRTTMTYRKRR